MRISRRELVEKQSIPVCRVSSSLARYVSKMEFPGFSGEVPEQLAHALRARRESRLRRNQDSLAEVDDAGQRDKLPVDVVENRPLALDSAGAERPAGLDLLDAPTLNRQLDALEAERELDAEMELADRLPVHRQLHVRLVLRFDLVLGERHHHHVVRRVLGGVPVLPQLPGLVPGADENGHAVDVEELLELVGDLRTDDAPHRARFRGQLRLNLRVGLAGLEIGEMIWRHVDALQTEELLDREA